MSDSGTIFRSGAIAAGQSVRHAFFTRSGGVSEGPYESLNCGFGSGDSPELVARNRAIAMHRLGLRADRLVTVHQVHSATVVNVDRLWRRDEAPRADGLVTAVPGIALGILAADCAPILFYEPIAKVIGAAHAGWRGALAGTAEAVIRQMTALGADRRRIQAAIGPCIGRKSYEVGPELPPLFLADNRGAACHFVRASREGHFLFDLGGYLAGRLRRTGIATVDVVQHDTVLEEAHFFSYRRSCLRGERVGGRGLSAIVLEE
jgi:YfiH family protein